jgi:hypothetical protein
VDVYGTIAKVRTAPSTPKRQVAPVLRLRASVVAGFPEHERDGVFVTGRSMQATAIIETFARRWSLGHTSHD